MSNNQNVPPGLQQPQISSYTLGAGNPRDSAMMANQNMNAKQANLNNAVGGRRKRLYKGGNSQPANVVVPQMQMQYTAQNGNSNPNTQIKGLSSTGMQGRAWAEKDNQATQMGGSRRRYRKGGNPNWIWGCYSGGRRRTNRRKSRKHRKRTRRNGH
jgi:hypothetical protein